MKRLLFLPAIIVFALAVITCTDSVTRQRLRHAEAVIEDAPDSALHILNTITEPQRLGDADKALYALLKTQAMYKSYITAPDDSLIAIACDYYAHTGDTRRQMLANFYRAGVLSDLGNYAEALYHALSAENICHSLSDTLFMARTNDILADCYRNSYLYDKEIERRHLAANYYMASGKKINELFTKFNLSLAYLNNSEYQKCEHLLDSLALLYKNGEYEGYFSNSLPLLYMRLYLDTKREKLVPEKFEQLLSLNQRDNITVQAIHYVALAHILSGDYATGKKYLDATAKSPFSDMDKVMDMHCKTKYYKGIHSLDSMSICYDSLYNLIHKRSETIAKLSVMVSQDNYYRDQSIKSEAMHVAAKKKALLISVIASLLLLSTIIALYVIRRRNKNRIAQKVSEIAEITTTLEMQVLISNDLASKNTGLQNQIEELHTCINSEKNRLSKYRINFIQSNILKNALYAEKFTFINNLCEKFFVCGNDTHSQRIIYKEITSQMKFLQSDEFKTDVVSSVDTELNGMLDNLFSKDIITDFERYLVSLLYFGFTTKAISVITQLKLGTIYYRKRKLLEKIQKLESSNEDMPFDLITQILD